MRWPRCGRLAPGRTGAPIVVNSSRAILYASAGDDFADRRAAEARRTRDMLQAARA
jgi:orotidine-5'-phosphate decarboxylase